jgi:hypothetical protein
MRMLIASFLVVLTPFVFAQIPAIGWVAARSRWTPIAWALAACVGILGYLLDRRGSLPDHRIAAVFWAPLYQLAVYTVALHVFLRAFHTRPRYAPLYAKGYGLDNFFAFIVLLTGIFPVMYFLIPQ